MNENECSIIRLPSGLYQGKIGDTMCFVCRNRPEEAMQDVAELFKRLNAEQVG